VPLQPADRVALLLPGSLAYVELVLELLRRGVVPVPMDPKLTSAERARLLPYVDASRVIDAPSELDSLLAEVRATPTLADVPLARPMHLTSGTTGSPKGVWSGVLSVESASALVAEERQLWGFTATDVNLVLSPLHHSAPLRFAIGTLLASGRVVIPGPFDPAEITATISSARPTTMFCVPTHLQRLFSYWDTVGAPDLTSFRLVAHAGAACPEALKRELIARFPIGTTWEFYGSTEGQFTACPSKEWLSHPGSVGRSRPGRSLRLDPDGTIWCAVPEHARFSYWQEPAKTAAAWREGPDGPEFSVGDLGRLDAEGYLYLDGRREDLIISGGVNVYPAEVEAVLGECAGVRDIAIFGVADPDWGARVCAAVVGDVSEVALRDFARTRLAPAKRPKEYHFLDALPMTATGKIRRTELVRRSTPRP
jgi:long-chain acyl-CoA synthetase